MYMPDLQLPDISRTKTYRNTWFCEQPLNCKGFTVLTQFCTDGLLGADLCPNSNLT